MSKPKRSPDHVKPENDSRQEDLDIDPQRIALVLADTFVKLVMGIARPIWALVVFVCRGDGRRDNDKPGKH